MTIHGIGVRCLGCIVAFASAHPLAAQTGALDSGRGFETRATLEAEVRAAEQEHRTGEAFLLNTRLKRGDFQEGDRIIVTLLGPTQFSDTVTVREGKMLPLPRMSDLPLEGVLRSELTSRLSSHLARYLRDSSARAVPLLRLAVLGRVQRPGYYYTSADVLLSDVIMKAGGPGPDANLNDVTIRRGGETIWNARDTHTALDEGLSIDRLHLRAGDELHVGETRGSNMMTILSVAGTVSAIAFTVLRFR